MTCSCGCGKTYTETRKDGTSFEVQFDPGAIHCRGCGTLVNKDGTRGGLCIDCLYKKLRATTPPTLFDRIGG